MHEPDLAQQFGAFLLAAADVEDAVPRSALEDYVRVCARWRELIRDVVELSARCVHSPEPGLSEQLIEKRDLLARYEATEVSDLLRRLGLLLDAFGTPLAAPQPQGCAWLWND